MNAKHHDGTLDGGTDALEAKQAICTVTVDYDDLRDKLFEELQRDYIIMTSEEYGELTAERERYREKFGKCLDYADAIHALMDDEGLA